MECAGSVEIRNLVLEKVVRDSALELQASSDWQGSLADAEGLHFQTSSSPRQVETGFGCGFGMPRKTRTSPRESPRIQETVHSVAVETRALTRGIASRF